MAKGSDRGDYIQRVVDAAPPLKTWQARRLAAIFAEAHEAGVRSEDPKKAPVVRTPVATPLTAADVVSQI